jgi:hypothetical protein
LAFEGRAAPYTLALEQAYAKICKETIVASALKVHEGRRVVELEGRNSSSSRSSGQRLMFPVRL